MAKLYRRLRALLRPGHARELAEEMRFHLEQKQAEGLSPEAAARAFGDDLRLREQSREAWGWLWLEGLARDARLAGRMMRRSPGFAAVAVLTLAVGIGGNLAVFSMVDAVALQPLAVPQPQQLVRMDWTSHAWSAPRDWGSDYTDAHGQDISTYFPYPLLEQWQRDSPTLQGVAAYRPLPRLDVSYGGRAEPAQGSLVSGGYQQVLGLRPALGRGITDSDMAAGAAPVAVLTYAYWKRRFAGDPKVVGRTMGVNHMATTIIGVEPQGFDGVEKSRAPEVLLPMSLVQSAMMHGMLNHPPQLSDRQYWFAEIFGRLRDGVSVETARANLEVGFRRLVASLPPDASNHGDVPRLLLYSARSGVINAGVELEVPMLVLFALTALVMLIVCANLANLLLARTAARRQELAIRVAIGAGRGALVRQQLTESLGLAVVGAMLGLPLGVAAAAGIVQRYLPPGIAYQPGWDANMMAAAAVLAVLAAVGMGLAPAVRATRRAPQPGLGRHARAGGSGLRLGEGLLAAQMALCLLVLSGAGLLLRTVQKYQTAPTGIDGRQITLIQLNAAMEGYSGAGLSGFYQRTLERLAHLPGVSAATAMTIAPGGTTGSSTRSLGTTSAATGNANPRTFLSAVAPGFFSTYGIPLLAGRDFNAGDDASATPVAIVNRAMAARFTGLPLGQKLYNRDGHTVQTVEVIGVAADSAYEGIGQPSQPVVYVPYGQRLETLGTLTFAVKSGENGSALAEEVRGAVAAEDAQVPILRIETQAAAEAENYTAQMMLAGMAAILGGLTLLLAALGLYGLMAYSVTRRTREMGVRIAMGASPRQVERLVLGHSVVLVLWGAAVGLPLAWLAGRGLKSLLFGVSPADPATWAGATLFLLVVALAAAWWPARRAARVDPVVALRCE